MERSTSRWSAAMISARRRMMSVACRSPGFPPLRPGSLRRNDASEAGFVPEFPNGGDRALNLSGSPPLVFGDRVGSGKTFRA